MKPLALLVLLAVLLPFASAESCSFCQILVDYARNDVNSGMTALDGLSRVCSQAPVDVTECANFLDTYGGALLSLLHKGLSSTATCTSIALC